MEVRIKVRHAMNTVERKIDAFGERLQLIARQIAVLTLDGPKIVEKQRSPRLT